MKATVWEGVYPDWARAPEAQDAFNEQRWINAQAEKALENLATLRREGAFSLSVKTRDYVLPVAAAMLARGNAVVRILDFGGGLASSYFTLRRCVRGPLDYHVVEMRSMVSEGRRLLSELDEVTFQDTIPQGHPVDWDIVHAGSSIQYVEDWRDTLDRFAALQPLLVVLSDVLAGKVPTFVTMQNYYEARIRARILNLDELVQHLDSRGYDLCYQSKYVAEIRGELGELPMQNFDVQHRLDHTCQLLFKRRG